MDHSASRNRWVSPVARSLTRRAFERTNPTIATSPARVIRREGDRLSFIASDVMYGGFQISFLLFYSKMGIVDDGRTPKKMKFWQTATPVARKLTFSLYKTIHH